MMWKKVKRSGNFRRKIKARLKSSNEAVAHPTSVEVCCSSTPTIDMTTELKNTNLLQEQDAYGNEEAMLNWVAQENSDLLQQEASVNEEVKSNWSTEMETEGEMTCCATETEQQNESYLTILEKNLTIRNRIRTWATSFRINQMALKELINILNERLPHVLPEDPRTLLSTPRSISINSIGNNGYYWHHGVEYCLQKCLQNVEELPSVINLNINVDGLPIYRSSKQEFWPILCNILELSQIKPMVFGIFWGFGKPNSVNDFLRPFVNEMNNIIQNGLLIKKNEKSYKVLIRIRAFICDSPARAFVKGTYVYFTFTIFSVFNFAL